MRRVLAVVAALAVLFAGCAAPTDGGTVEPGTGPAASEPISEPSDEPTTLDEEPTEEPSEEPTEEPTEEAEDEESLHPEPEVATFKQRYTYEDGVEVEVIKIRHGKVTAEDEEALADAKAGTPWVQLTVRVKNGSKKRIDADSSTFTITYGPDGDSAESFYVPSVDNTSMSGKILPGRSKVGSDTFRIPPRYQGDVVLEYSFDYDHEAAIFAGSVK